MVKAPQGAAASGVTGLAGDARGWTISAAEVAALSVRNVAGLMTGTSMDGLDVALCRITSAPLGFELLAFETVPMQADLRRSLAAEQLADVGAIARANMALGRYFAEETPRLKELESDGLVSLTADAVSVTSLGRIFIRNVGMVFDKYLRKPRAKPLFSKTL